jgi:hypothetical protein
MPNAATGLARTGFHHWNSPRSPLRRSRAHGKRSRRCVKLTVPQALVVRGCFEMLPPMAPGPQTHYLLHLTEAARASRIGRPSESSVRRFIRS